MFKDKRILVVILGIALGLSLLANFLLYLALRDSLLLIKTDSQAQISPPSFGPQISPPPGPPPY